MAFFTIPVRSTIFSFLSSRDALMVICTCKAAGEALRGDDQIWNQYLHQDFDTTREVPGSRSEWARLYESLQWLGMTQSLSLACIHRAVRSWNQIKSLLAHNVPVIRDSLNPGLPNTPVSIQMVQRELRRLRDLWKASEEEGGEGDSPGEGREAYSTAIHPLVMIMYHIVNGQSLSYDDLLYDRDLYWTRRRGVPMPDIDESLFHGVFGGYCYYNNLVSMRMFDLEKAMDLTQKMFSEHVNLLMSGHRQNRLRGGKVALPQRFKNKVIFASNWNSTRIIFVDIVTAELFVTTQPTRGDLPGLIPVFRSRRGTVLDWIEAFAENLTSHTFSFSPLISQESGTKSINLYPLRGSHCTSRETDNIRITSSVIFLPEASEAGGKSAYTYSIAMRMIPRDSGLKRAQLSSRHWLIEESVGGSDTYVVKDEVEGAGVIGLYPILDASDTSDFVYQSCTTCDESKGRMGGDLTFESSGREIKAVVQYFPLQIPEVIF